MTEVALYELLRNANYIASYVGRPTVLADDLTMATFIRAPDTSRAPATLTFQDPNAIARPK